MGGTSFNVHSIQVVGVGVRSSAPSLLLMNSIVIPAQDR